MLTVGVALGFLLLLGEAGTGSPYGHGGGARGLLLIKESRAGWQRSTGHGVQSSEFGFQSHHRITS